MVDRFAVSCTPSVRTLQLLVERGAQQQNKEGAGKVLLASHPKTLPQLELPEMQHAPAEAEELSKFFADQGVAVEKMVGEELGVRPLLTKLLEQQPGWVHITAHGKPKCLALAPAMAEAEAEEGAPEAFDDGLLGLEALLTVFLTASPTVVLTGNHTFAGELMEDGVCALPRSWMAAGARSVVCNLWAAPDESMKLLSADFYRLHMAEKMPQAAALRQAILNLRQAEGGKFSHPIYWAGFMLLGQ